MGLIKSHAMIIREWAFFSGIYTWQASHPMPTTACKRNFNFSLPGSLITSHLMADSLWVVLYLFSRHSSHGQQYVREISILFYQGVSSHHILWLTVCEWHCIFFQVIHHASYHEQQIVSDTTSFFRWGHEITSTSTGSEWHFIFIFPGNSISSYHQFVSNTAILLCQAVTPHGISWPTGSERHCISWPTGSERHCTLSLPGILTTITIRMWVPLLFQPFSSVITPHPMIIREWAVFCSFQAGHITSQIDCESHQCFYSQFHCFSFWDWQGVSDVILLGSPIISWPTGGERWHYILFVRWFTHSD